MPKKKKSKDDGEHIAFVISPIGEPNSSERKRADQILEHVIEPVVSKLGYKAIRADNIPKPGVITTQVIEHIINAPLVIADLTGHNPNVFYELAVRHAIKKPVIQIIQKGEKIPFDVSTQRTIQINHTDLDSVAEAKKKLERQMKAVKKDPSLVDSPISMAVNFQFMKQSGNPERKAIAELRGTVQVVNHKVDEILRQLTTRNERLFSQSSPLISFPLSSSAEMQASPQFFEDYWERTLRHRPEQNEETGGLVDFSELTLAGSKKKRRRKKKDK